MKPQDILFFIVLFFLLWKRNFRITVAIGLTCLVLAIPLFARHIFFTAQHIVWYAAGFFLLAIIFNLFIIKETK